MKITLAALLLAAGPAAASCPLGDSAVLDPGANEIYGCPVYWASKPMANGQTKFWFSNSRDAPIDNNLYGFYITDEASGSLATAIRQIVSNNWQLSQFINSHQFGDFALTGITFKVTGTITGAEDNGTPIISGGDTFPTPVLPCELDGVCQPGTKGQLAIVINPADIRQGF